MIMNRLSSWESLEGRLTRDIGLLPYLSFPWLVLGYISLRLALSTAGSGHHTHTADTRALPARMKNSPEYPFIHLFIHSFIHSESQRYSDSESLSVSS